MQQIRNSVQNKKASRFESLLICNNTLAGKEGFEPPNAGTKTRCLTTWRLPKNEKCAGV